MKRKILKKMIFSFLILWMNVNFGSCSSVTDYSEMDWYVLTGKAIDGDIEAQLGLADIKRSKGDQFSRGEAIQWYGRVALSPQQDKVIRAIKGLDNILKQALVRQETFLISCIGSDDKNFKKQNAALISSAQRGDAKSMYDLGYKYFYKTEEAMLEAEGYDLIKNSAFSGYSPAIQALIQIVKSKVISAG